jgi:hypothetical protein
VIGQTVINKARAIDCSTEFGDKLLEAVSKKSFGPNSLLGTRFPALRDDPSNFILLVGLKSSIRLRRTSGLRRSFKNLNRRVIRLCVKPRGRLDFEPKSFF